MRCCSHPALFIRVGQRLIPVDPFFFFSHTHPLLSSTTHTISIPSPFPYILRLRLDRSQPWRTPSSHPVTLLVSPTWSPPCSSSSLSCSFASSRSPTPKASVAVAVIAIASVSLLEPPSSTSSTKPSVATTGSAPSTGLAQTNGSSSLGLPELPTSPTTRYYPPTTRPATPCRLHDLFRTCYARKQMTFPVSAVWVNSWPSSVSFWTIHWLRRRRMEQRSISQLNTLTLSSPISVAAFSHSRVISE